MASKLSNQNCIIDTENSETSTSSPNGGVDSKIHNRHNNNDIIIRQ